MLMQCACGHSEDQPMAVIVRMGTPPNNAVSVWTESCPTCQPRSGLYPWGWTLVDGRKVHCLFGDDEAEAAGAVPVERHRMQ